MMDTLADPLQDPNSRNSGLTPDARYARQIILPEIGPHGQQRLADSRVLVVGAGGLGSPLLMALAGAGVGRLTLVDADTVSVSNLNRQFLYTAADLGQTKATIAAKRLEAYRPDLIVESHSKRLDESLAARLFPDQDLIIAAVDNRSTRMLINQLCYELGQTWIDGAVRGFSGYATWFSPHLTPCYACCFDIHPDGLPSDQPPRAPSGALGATASVIGSLEADLALLHLLDLPMPLVGEVFYYHGRTLDCHSVPFYRRPNCPVCGGES